MGELSFVQSNDGWSVVVIGTGKSYTFDHDHPQYGVLLQALTDQDVDTFESHITIAQAVQCYISDVEDAGEGNTVEVVDGIVVFNGQQLHNSMTTRIVDNMRAGVPYENMLLFLQNLLANPSFKSKEQLYNFLERNGLPITADGHFLAYKTVRKDYRDKYTGTIDNSVGTVVTMNRSEIDDDSNSHCSQGLHAGGLDYAGPGGWYNDEADTVVIVKINPCDAVSVPNDHNHGKLRVCRYEVVADYKGAMDKPCYEADASEFASYKTPTGVPISEFIDIDDVHLDDCVQFEDEYGNIRRGVVVDLDEEYDDYEGSYFTIIQVLMSFTDNQAGAKMWFGKDEIDDLKVINE